MKIVLFVALNIRLQYTLELCFSYQIYSYHVHQNTHNKYKSLSNLYQLMSSKYRVKTIFFISLYSISALEMLIYLLCSLSGGMKSYERKISLDIEVGWLCFSFVFKLDEKILLLKNIYCCSNPTRWRWSLLLLLTMDGM